ncbi:hypothetical protein [Flavobacterium sp.]|uniref:hypothetical protein n=1 Tax=Flavobacterium sp. TaxID=239 RepID=UPI003D6BB890
MKRSYYCLFFFLLHFSLLAQDDSIISPKQKLSVVSAERMNIVYRGVSNPINIAVSNAKSFTATGDGLLFKNGKYTLKPGIGSEVKISLDILLNDNSKIIEEHVFKIKGLPALIGLIQGNNCLDCLVGMPKKDFKNAKISTKMENFMFVESDSEFFEVKSFDVKFLEGKIISVEGNRISNEVFSEISKLKKGDIFEIAITDYGFYTHALKRKVYPIRIIISD